MQVSLTVINAMLNQMFVSGTATYTLSLISNGSIATETITFTTSTTGSTGLVSSRFFVVPSGVTVTGLSVYRDDGILFDNTILTNTFDSSITFNANGTLTVNVLTTNLSAV